MQGKKMDPDDSVVGSRPSISVSQQNNKYKKFSYMCMFYALKYLHFCHILFHCFLDQWYYFLHFSFFYLYYLIRTKDVIERGAY